MKFQCGQTPASHVVLSVAYWLTHRQRLLKLGFDTHRGSLEQRKSLILSTVGHN